jgi:hypothetical protein
MYVVPWQLLVWWYTIPPSCHGYCCRSKAVAISGCNPAHATAFSAAYFICKSSSSTLTENMQRHPTPACKAAHASKAAQARIAGLTHDNALLAVKLNT